MLSTYLGYDVQTAENIFRKVCGILDFEILPLISFNTLFIYLIWRYFWNFPSHSWPLAIMGVRYSWCLAGNSFNFDHPHLHMEAFLLLILYLSPSKKTSRPTDLSYTFSRCTGRCFVSTWGLTWQPRTQPHMLTTKPSQPL